jgi:hypothetical protein
MNRVAIIGLTAYILFLELKCPCPKMMECSIKQLVAATGAIGLLMMYEYK